MDCSHCLSPSAALQVLVRRRCRCLSQAISVRGCDAGAERMDLLKQARLRQLTVVTDNGRGPNDPDTGAATRRSVAPQPPAPVILPCTLLSVIISSVVLSSCVNGRPRLCSSFANWSRRLASRHKKCYNFVRA